MYKRYDICFCLTSLTVIITRSIHVAANGLILFFFYCWLIFHCIYILLLLYPFIFDGYLSVFHVLTIINSAAMNIGVSVSFWIPFLFFLTALYQVWMFMVGGRTERIWIASSSAVLPINSQPLWSRLTYKSCWWWLSAGEQQEARQGNYNQNHTLRVDVVGHIVSIIVVILVILI